jgi:ABC-type transporter Mla subunit MlaD
MALPSPSTELKVGLFLLAVLALAVFTVVYIGIKKELFAEKVYYFVVSATSEKVERGSPVKISGFRVGQVSDVTMHDIDYIKIELKVLKKHMVWFRKGTRVTLAGGFPFGASYVNVEPGPEEAPVLSPGATLELSREEDLLATLRAESEPVIEDVKATVANMRAISERMADPEGTLNRALANLEVLTQQMTRGQGLLSMLTLDEEPVRQIKSILGNSDQLLAGLNDLSQTVNAKVRDIEPLQEQMTELLASIDAFVVQLDRIGRQLEPAVADVNAITGEVRNATTDLDRMRAQGERTLQLGGDVMQRLRKTWPLSRGDGQENTQEYPMP